MKKKKTIGKELVQYVRLGGGGGGVILTKLVGKKNWKKVSHNFYIQQTNDQV